MAVEQVELARLWGLSRGRISQMVKIGMPLSSLEEAAAWRVAHFGGSPVKGGQGGQVKTDSALNGGGDFDLPPKPEPVPESHLKREDVEGTLARLIKNEMIAWVGLAKAVNAKDENAILVNQRKFGDAAAMRIKLESEVDAMLLRKREMVLIAEAQELFGRHLQAVRMALKSMPSRICARCNPSDPALAKAALHDAVAVVFKQMNEWEV